MLPPVPRCCWRVLKAAVFLWFALSAGERLHALDAKALQAMVIVEGDEGRGSGFVVKMGGQTFLITNSHVVRGNRNVKFKNLRNVDLATGPLQIADKADAVRAFVTGVTNTLELEPQIEKVKIGDEVIVAGNAEGEGVVREIPGKVVGIGPDRIEVDAEFVPGNSGSPILLKSTGKVIGVATYMKIPRLRAGGKSPFSLNEIRRFGFRLDTVARWVTPPTKDRLLLEGMKLAEMESLIGSIISVLNSNAVFVAKWGASNFVSRDQARQYPAFAALSLAIDDFARDQAAATTGDARTKGATSFFAKLKGIVDEDTRGLIENQFSGFYAVQLKDSLGRFKEFNDWYEGTAMPAFRETWLSSQSTTARLSNLPPIDPDKFKLVLSDRIAPGEPPEYCHHVGYPAEAEPPNMEGLYWVTVEPGGTQRAFQMHRANLRVRSELSGTYKVYVEYRGGDKTKVVSNVVEFKYAGANGGVPVAASKPAGRPVDARSLAKVEVEDAAVLKLASDAKIWSDRDVQITTIPPAFAGLQFTQHKAHAVNLKFKVRTDGMVYMGCSARWGGTAAPDVAKTLVTAEQLEKEGWVREEPYQIATTAADMTFVIFSRSCKAGQEFNYRTEKYAPPILLTR